MRFRAGQTLVKRFFTLGASPHVVTCGRVLSDDERGLLLWVAEGSPVRWTVAADGRGPRDMPFDEWLAAPKRLEPRTWQGCGVLMLMPPGASHSVWWFWRGAGASFSGWYGNLEAPAVRWDDGDAAGIDSVDHDLDVVIAPDRSWQWKDEAELAERSAYPEHYWVSDPDEVRAEGERLVKVVEAGTFPFDGTWCDFRPEPSWPVPTELPAGWDRPRVAPHPPPGGSGTTRVS